MSGLLENVNQRTQLVGQNRLELLIFRLHGDQIYGINVFKVKEVLQCPALSQLPKSNPIIRGIASIRGSTISIMDLSLATAQAPLEDVDNCFVIIAEYNTVVQGFLVKSVDRIININWDAVHPPPHGSGSEHYLTAVTEVDGKLVEIIDVEKILAELSPEIDTQEKVEVSDEISRSAMSKHVLIVDDSAVARKQIQRCVESVGVQTTLFKNGKEALDHLQSLVGAGESVADKYLMMISDIEMPEMDGYTLTAYVREDPQLAAMHIVLHTSLSGVFNQAMVAKVSADDFLAKFNPTKLASMVTNRIEQVDT
jgi:two-component system chemotaxis response regulator CheV